MMPYRLPAVKVEGTKATIAASSLLMGGESISQVTIGGVEVESVVSESETEIVVVVSSNAARRNRRQAGGDDDSVKIGDVGGGVVDTAVYVRFSRPTQVPA